MKRTVLISPVLLLAMSMAASVGYTSAGQARVVGEMTSCTDRHAARQWLVGVVRALGGEYQRVTVSPAIWNLPANRPMPTHWVCVLWDATCVTVDSQMAFSWKHDLPPPVAA